LKSGSPCGYQPVRFCLVDFGDDDDNGDNDDNDDGDNDGNDDDDDGGGGGDGSDDDIDGDNDDGGNIDDDGEMVVMMMMMETALNPECLSQKVTLEKAGDLKEGNMASRSHPHRRLVVSKLHTVPTDIIFSSAFKREEQGGLNSSDDTGSLSIPQRLSLTVRTPLRLDQSSSKTPSDKLFHPIEDPACGKVYMLLFVLRHANGDGQVLSQSPCLMGQEAKASKGSAISCSATRCGAEICTHSRAPALNLFGVNQGNLRVHLLKPCSVENLWRHVTLLDTGIKSKQHKGGQRGDTGPMCPAMELQSREDLTSGLGLPTAR
ncbi:hypothetical protein STEG23_029531, partial [Scotinomys teguina]